MIKLPIKINGHKCMLPTAWEHLTLKQFFELENWRIEGTEDIVRLVSILVDKPYNFVSRVRTQGFETVITNNIGWLAKGNFNPRKQRIGKEVMIAGHKVEVPRDLSACEWGQKISIDQEFQKIEAKYAQDVLSKAMYKKANTAKKRLSDIAMNKIGYNQMTFILAVYLQPLYYKTDFELAKAKAFKLIIEEQNLIDLYPIGDFFLRRLRGYGRLRMLFQNLRQSLNTKGQAAQTS